MPSNPSPAHMVKSNQVGKCAPGPCSSGASRRAEPSRPARIDLCPWGWTWGCCRPGAGWLEFSRDNPRTMIGPLTQVQSRVVTSVDPRVSGSGCAKMRKTGAHTAPQAAQAAARRWTSHSLLLQTGLARWTQSQAPAGRNRPLTVGVPGARMVALCQATDFLPFQPENEIGQLTQVQSSVVTSVDPRVSGSGCAKMRKTGAHSAPERAQTGAEAN